jgi:hypothetical protein
MSGPVNGDGILAAVHCPMKNALSSFENSSTLSR